MDSIINLIKEKGQRVTVQKICVLRALQDKPQTVLEIWRGAQKHQDTLDKVTVYRILTGLINLNIVHKIQLGDGEARYETNSDEHHHHLICDECGKIEDVELSEKALLNEVREQSSFKIKRHALEFFGICKKCQ